MIFLNRIPLDAVRGGAQRGQDGRLETRQNRIPSLDCVGWTSGRWSKASHDSN